MKNTQRNEKINLFLRRLGPLMRVSLSAFIPHESNWINSVTDIFLKEVCRLKEERGIAWTISYVKTCRNCIMRTLSGNPLEESPGVSLKGGYPTAFYQICRESEGNIDRIRILLTLFTSLRGITLPPNPDFSTIDAPYSGVDDITDSEILKVAHSLKLTNFYSNLEKKKLRSKPTSFCEFHSSTKNGPQGQAILNAPLEATLIPNNLLSDLKLIGGIKLAFHLDGLRRYYSTAGTIFAKIGQYILPLESKRKGSFRKIAYFSDKEGKTRIIAMLDYWSQCALRPLHMLLNKMLRRIPNDCTFNQGNFLSLELNKASNSYHSIDLTAATDRMPIALQKRVIGIFIGSELSDAWERILIDHPFYLKRPDKVETTIKYMVGQPMGAYSSWPAMALTHHFLVRISALRAGLPASFDDYFLLGDDLVIANDSVAEQYKLLIAKLGMPYSKDKTHVSQHTFEFAKRWFHYGQEITGFPIGGLISTYHRYPLLAAFLSSQSERGWRLHGDLHPDLIRNIFKIMKEGHFYKRKVESSIKLYMIFLSLLEFKRRPEGDQVYEVFFQRISQIANPAHLLATFGSPKKAFVFLLIKAKYELLKSDLERIRKSSMHLDNYQNGWKRSIHDMSPGGMSRSNFGIKLTRHIGQVNRSPTLDPTSNPLQMVISSQMKQLYELVNPVNFGSPYDLLPPEIILDGLGRYNLTGELFSMRSSVSSALAESAITKKVIEAIVSGNYLLSDPSNIEVATIINNPSRSPEMAVLNSSIFPIIGITRFLASPTVQRILIKVPLLSRLIPKKAVSTIIWNAVVSRLKSTIGVTFFASLIAIKVGVTDVVHFIHALYLAVQALFIKAAILPGTESTWTVIGYYMFHLVEVFLAGVILATWYHSSYFIEASTFILKVYQGGQFTEWMVCFKFYKLMWEIIYSTSLGIEPASIDKLLNNYDSWPSSQVIEKAKDMGPKEIVVFGSMTAMLYAFIQYIIFIMF